MDCTGSMSSYLNRCKDEIYEITDNIQRDTPGVKIRVSFVGYRDFEAGDQNMTIIGFTDSIPNFKNQIRDVRCAFGQGPEDMCSGLEYCLKQDWLENSTKVAVLIADMPCHGKKYSSQFDQHACNHPTGDRYGRNIEDFVKKLARCQIDLYSVKINNYNDQMMKIFNMVYKNIAHKDIIESDLGDGGNPTLKKNNNKICIGGRTANSAFSSFISNSATQSLSQRYTGNSCQSKKVNKKNQLIQDFTRLIANKDKLKDSNKLEQIIDFMSNLQGIDQKNIAELAKAQAYIKDEIRALTNVEKEIDENKKKLENTKLIKFEYDVKFDDVLLMKQKRSDLLPQPVYVNAHSFHVVDDNHSKSINWKDPEFERHTIKTSLKLAKNPFSEGHFRYAFQGYDNTTGIHMVCKIMKDIEA